MLFQEKVGETLSSPFSVGRLFLAQRRIKRRAGEEEKKGGGGNEDVIYAASFPPLISPGAANPSSSRKY